MNFNPYESTRGSSDAKGAEKCNSSVKSLLRYLLLSISAVTGSFSLVYLWQWTAQFTWSSDAWLMEIPTVIVWGGLSAIVLLVFIAVLRIIKSFKISKSKTETIRKD